jgi:hypothetical protein
VTPQEYAVRAVRAWVTNHDMDTVPELSGDSTDRMNRDRFIHQVLDAAQEIVGVATYAIIAEQQDEEWQRFACEVAEEELSEMPYPVRFTLAKEVIQ